MKTFYMEVKSEKAAESWQEELNLNVPSFTNSARFVEHISFDDPTAAAMATMDYFNKTLKPGENSRQVIRVFYENPDKTETELWKGCYPE